MLAKQSSYRRQQTSMAEGPVRTGLGKHRGKSWLSTEKNVHPRQPSDFKACRVGKDLYIASSRWEKVLVSYGSQHTLYSTLHNCVGVVGVNNAVVRCEARKATKIQLLISATCAPGSSWPKQTCSPCLQVFLC